MECLELAAKEEAVRIARTGLLCAGRPVAEATGCSWAAGSGELSGQQLMECSASTLEQVCRLGWCDTLLEEPRSGASSAAACLCVFRGRREQRGCWHDVVHQPPACSPFGDF